MDMQFLPENTFIPRTKDLISGAARASDLILRLVMRRVRDAIVRYGGISRARREARGVRSRHPLAAPWAQMACGTALGLVAAGFLLHNVPRTQMAAKPASAIAIPAERSSIPISAVDVAALALASASDTIDAQVLMASPGATTAKVARFRYDLKAFAADLMATGWVSPLRARYISYWAVTEAYRQGVPPSLVLAVMSVENDSYKSHARSSAGAVGLMQIMPRVWLSTLGPTYGWNLENDRTNVAMGIQVLADNLKSQQGDWYHALLRYNGCTRGTRTPTCFNYPVLVQRALIRRAHWSCPGGDFHVCVERPLAGSFSRPVTIERSTSE